MIINQRELGENISGLAFNENVWKIRLHE